MERGSLLSTKKNVFGPSTLFASSQISVFILDFNYHNYDKRWEFVAGYILDLWLQLKSTHSFKHKLIAIE